MEDTDHVKIMTRNQIFGDLFQSEAENNNNQHAYLIKTNKMSTKRPGVQAAVALYEHNHIELWDRYYAAYKDAVKLVSTQKKKNELIALDEWLWKDLKNDVYDRYKLQPSEGYYLTKEELSKIMTWKLIRGKFRPLQKLVDSNSSESVKSYSNKALTILCSEENKNNRNWKAALKELNNLKGIGVATSSAILSIFAPDMCPFMADEVIDTVYCGKRDYTLPVYVSIQSSLIEKMHILNGHVRELSNEHSGNHKWDVEMIGKALWTAAIFSAFDISIDNKRVSNDMNTESGLDTGTNTSTAGNKRRRVD